MNLPPYTLGDLCSVGMNAYLDNKDTAPTSYELIGEVVADRIESNFEVYTDFEKRLIRHLLEQEYFRVRPAPIELNTHQLSYLSTLEQLREKLDEAE